MLPSMVALPRCLSTACHRKSLLSFVLPFSRISSVTPNKACTILRSSSFLVPLHHATPSYNYATRLPHLPNPTRYTTKIAAALSKEQPATASAVASPPPDRNSLLKFVKEKAAKKAVRKIVTALEESEQRIGPWGENGVQPDSAIYGTAIRSLLRAARIDLATQLYKQRREAHVSRPDELPPDISLAVSVLRGVFRECKKRNQRAEYITELFNAIVHESKAMLDKLEEADPQSSHLSRTVSGLLSTTAVFLENDDRGRASAVFGLAAELGKAGPHAAVNVDEYNTAIRLLGKNRLLNDVFKVLDMMRAAEVSSTNETFEFLANAAVRQVRFITGAVSMDTLPEPLGAEVAFVGRSNVGKSSLVNMLCNRKALAYVSGRPGKTQQFNYFLVNERDKDSQFYMVDLPGVGYAQVPIPVKKKWLNFMREYFQYRLSVRLVFHLIDGRHGALEDDEQLMAEMAYAGRAPNYVIVLTKMDKMDKQRVKQSILDKTKSALQRNGCSLDTPIVLTSASSRLGRDEMWRHLQTALTTIA